MAKEAELIAAAYKGDLATVQALLSVRRQNQMDIDALEEDWTALMYAVSYGYVKIVEQLLAAGAGVDVTNNNGATPLYVASEHGQMEAIDRLLTAGADTTLECEGLTPLDVAKKRSDTDIIKLLEAAATGGYIKIPSETRDMTPFICNAEDFFAGVAVQETNALFWHALYASRYRASVYTSYVTASFANNIYHAGYLFQLLSGIQQETLQQPETMQAIAADSAFVAIATIYVNLPIELQVYICQFVYGAHIFPPTWISELSRRYHRLCTWRTAHDPAAPAISWRKYIAVIEAKSQEVEVAETVLLSDTEAEPIRLASLSLSAGHVWNADSRGDDSGRPKPRP